MNHFLDKLDSHPPVVVLLLSLILTVLVGIADVLTGPELSSAIFYVVPIGLAGWYGSRLMGTAIAMLSAVAWLIADTSGTSAYSHSIVPYWNALMRLGLFIIIVYLLASFRQKLREEELRAVSDPLTGLYNVRGFYQLAEQEIVRLDRYHHPFSVGYVDLEHFKEVNDCYGHNAGDAVLKTVAEVMKRDVRENDIVSRLGGDEFALLLLETGERGAKTVINGLRRDLLAAMTELKCPVTFSIGVVTFLVPPHDVKEMVKHADELMYVVKKHGKNGFLHGVVKEKYVPPTISS